MNDSIKGLLRIAWSQHSELDDKGKVRLGQMITRLNEEQVEAHLEKMKDGRSDGVAGSDLL